MLSERGSVMYASSGLRMLSGKPPSEDTEESWVRVAGTPRLGSASRHRWSTTASSSPSSSSYWGQGECYLICNLEMSAIIVFGKSLSIIGYKCY